MESKRRRGAPLGNHNALKHGYYSKGFDRARKADYCSAGDVRGLDEEIALLRLVIKKAAIVGDHKNLQLLVKTANALNKLVRTRDKLLTTREDQIRIGINNVMRDVAAPLGIGPFAAHNLNSENKLNNNV